MRPPIFVVDFLILAIVTSKQSIIFNYGDNPQSVQYDPTLDIADSFGVGHSPFEVGLFLAPKRRAKIGVMALNMTVFPHASYAWRSGHAQQPHTVNHVSRCRLTH
jgi:hypothetical protein